MRVLLDTHVWLWLLTDPEKIPSKSMAIARDESNELFLSVASGWEIAIKYGIGKLPLPEPPSTYVPSRLSATGVQVLPVTLNHVLSVAELQPHHRDPFDRMLVCQSRIENIPLMTADGTFSAYGTNIVWD